MSGPDLNAIKKMTKTIADVANGKYAKKPSPSNTKAVVRRIEGNTAYVHFLSEGTNQRAVMDETPVDCTISARPGDIVQLRVEGKKGWIVGNYTSPPTDNLVANKALNVGNKARNAANNAQIAADGAQATANDALSIGTIAKEAADNAQLSADGKNKIYRTSTKPTIGPFADGDIWFDTSNDNAISRYDSSQGDFIAVELGDDAISDLSANKLTAGTIDASVITVSNLDAGNITTGIINAALINAIGNSLGYHIGIESDKIVFYKDDDTPVFNVALKTDDFNPDNPQAEISRYGTDRYAKLSMAWPDRAKLIAEHGDYISQVGVISNPSIGTNGTAASSLQSNYADDIGTAYLATVYASATSAGSYVNMTADNDINLTAANVNINAKLFANALSESLFTESSITLFSSASIAGGNYKDGSTTQAKAKYYPLAISGWDSSARYGQLADCYISSRSVGSVTVSYLCYNPDTSSHSITCTAKVLWVRVTE